MPVWRATFVSQAFWLEIILGSRWSKNKSNFFEKYLFGPVGVIFWGYVIYPKSFGIYFSTRTQGFGLVEWSVWPWREESVWVEISEVPLQVEANQAIHYLTKMSSDFQNK